MRTTLTLADDVAVQLERLRRSRRAPFKEVVNEALREGLKQLAAPKRPRKAFHTATVDLGRCLIGSVDDVSEALAIAEGDAYR